MTLETRKERLKQNSEIFLFISVHPCMLKNAFTFYNSQHVILKYMAFIWWRWYKAGNVRHIYYSQQVNCFLFLKINSTKDVNCILASQSPDKNNCLWIFYQRYNLRWEPYLKPTWSILEDYLKPETPLDPLSTLKHPQPQ